MPGEDHRVEQSDPAKQVGPVHGAVEGEDAAQGVADGDYRAIGDLLQIVEHIAGQVVPGPHVGGGAAGPEGPWAVAKDTVVRGQTGCQRAVRFGWKAIRRRQVHKRPGAAKVEVVRMHRCWDLRGGRAREGAACPCSPVSRPWRRGGAVKRRQRPRREATAHLLFLSMASAVHAAPPHNAAMNIRLFLGGRSPPRPSRGWRHGETGFPHAPAGRGCGETRFPHTPRRGLIFTLERPGWMVPSRAEPPFPDPPPRGEGTGLLRPAGGGREGGRLRTANLLRPSVLAPLIAPARARAIAAIA